MPIISQGLDYNVDIVMCIDATGSMGPIINDVKRNALSFYQKFVDEMNAKGKSVQQLRIKVIVFRDYGVDSEPMVESKFFLLDDEKEEFANFVNKIEASGGGDAPENSLEALALAMKSDWVRTGAVRRHVIMLYTDNTALALGERRDAPSYPKDMPASMADLRDIWDGQDMERRAKRLLLFAPDVEPWSTDMFDWENCFLTASQAGAGCDDTDIEQCIHILVNSI
ncbi:MAG: VWA domain-containing protein [Bacilli bacterium]|nr:VWA domain-containing protein [Bacilli bacterium]